jgi:TRAP-type C4-dicarboxylate transport system permease small subunit
VKGHPPNNTIVVVFTVWEAVRVRPVEMILDTLARVMLALGVGVALLMALHVTADVFSRFVFRLPFAGTLEIVSHYYMVALTFAPLAYVQKLNGHIAAELFTQAVPARLLSAINAAICLLMCGFAAVLAWRTGIEAVRATEISLHVQAAGYFIYIWPTRWLLPAGLGVMALYALLQAAKGVSAAAR